MEINVTQEKGKVPVSVVHIKGDLDASSRSFGMRVAIYG